MGENITSPIHVWCLLRDQFAHVKPVEEAFAGAAQFTYDDTWEPEVLRRAKPDLVLCVNDFHYDVVRCLDTARAGGIPSLVLQDGILEWRCQYENPLFGAGGGAPQHQPVMADKIACIGAQSARQLARWGNAPKVEVTGMPRLDSLLNRAFSPRRSPGNRLLVMTAKNPGFTPAQRQLTLQSLKDLKTHLDTQPGLQVRWRVSRDLVEPLGIQNEFSQLGGGELVTLLEESDAAITTLSTTVLEVMLAGRPVAALDYHNVPRFLPTAWTISAREQIPAVVRELLLPPAAKLAFQADCLADCLETSGPASSRVRTLIEQCVAHAHAARASGSPLRLPAGLLGGGVLLAPAAPLDLAAIYGSDSAFGMDDLQALRLRLARADNENRRLKRENASLRKKLSLAAVARRGVEWTADKLGLGRKPGNPGGSEKGNNANE